MTQALEGPGGEVVVDAANSLWGQAGIQWEQPFLDTLAREYGTGMRQVDFGTAVEAARALINGWTAEQTHDKITELIPAGVLDSLTRLVLVNAIYLKAPWLGPFSQSYTKPEPFRLTDGSRVDVPMMGGASIQFGWHQGDAWEAVRLEYDGRAFAMTVVVPGADTGALHAGPVRAAQLEARRVRRSPPPYVEVPSAGVAQRDPLGARDADRVLRDGRGLQRHDER